MVRVSAITAVILSSALLIGCESGESTDTMPDSASMGMLNSKCPMMGTEVDASSPTADYNGAKVAFCCDRCVAAWNGKTMEEKKDLLSKAR